MHTHADNLHTSICDVLHTSFMFWPISIKLQQKPFPLRWTSSVSYSHIVVICRTHAVKLPNELSSRVRPNWREQNRWIFFRNMQCLGTQSSWSQALNIIVLRGWNGWLCFVFVVLGFPEKIRQTNNMFFAASNEREYIYKTNPQNQEIIYLFFDWGGLDFVEFLACLHFLLQKKGFWFRDCLNLYTIQKPLQQPDVYLETIFPRYVLQQTVHWPPWSMHWIWHVYRGEDIDCLPLAMPGHDVARWVYTVYCVWSMNMIICISSMIYIHI